MSPARSLITLAAVCGLCAPAPYVAAQGPAVAIASAAPALSTQQAAERYVQAEAFERKHDLRSAFSAYSEAGEAGHPLAQKKLGDYYSAGNSAVPRDYESALKWYQKAREQGVEIPAPFTYPTAPVGTTPR